MIWMASEPAVRQFERIFVDTLREQGYAIGRNLTYEPLYADGVAARLPTLVDEAIAKRPDVMVGIEQVAQVMKRRTATIPIVLPNASDPIAAGLVQSLARPGGNVTGASFVFEQLGPKHMELLREFLPRLTRVGQVHDTTVPGSKTAEENARQAAKRLGLAYFPYYVGSKADLEKALATMENDRVEALVWGAGSGLLFGLRQMFVEHVLRMRIVQFASSGQYAELGALMSYGPDLKEGFRLAAEYAARILKGAKPAELPVQQPTRFEMVINLKTAKALGVAVPNALLLRADRIVE
jgi:putative ABC transport system substrate-binding protein